MLPSTSVPYVPTKVLAQKVSDDTGGSGGGSSDDVKPNDNSGGTGGSSNHHTGSRRGGGSGSGGTPSGGSHVDQGLTSQFSTSGGQPCIDPMTGASICNSGLSSSTTRPENLSGGSINAGHIGNTTVDEGRPQRECPPGTVRTQLNRGPPCVRYSIAVGTPEEVPTMTISCDAKNNLLVQGEGSGFVANHFYRITAIAHRNNNVAGDLLSSAHSDNSGHLLLINPLVARPISGRYTLIVDELDSANTDLRTGITYSISFDIPLDCSKPLILDFVRGQGDVPPEITGAAPLAFPTGDTDVCLPGQEERGLVGRGTVCISPGYAVLISCKQISIDDARSLGGAGAIGRAVHLTSVFEATISIGNYRNIMYWGEPDLNAPSGRVGECSVPLSITAGTHFAINESRSSQWTNMSSEGDCQSTAVASRVYICTLVNAYRPS
jgi:hypothetical protein